MLIFHFNSLFYVRFSSFCEWNAFSFRVANYDDARVTRKKTLSTLSRQCRSICFLFFSSCEGKIMSKLIQFGTCFDKRTNVTERTQTSYFIHSLIAFLMCYQTNTANSQTNISKCRISNEKKMNRNVLVTGFVYFLIRFISQLVHSIIMAIGSPFTFWPFLK